jgi:uncharacterized tellurite resistance protein B-like protein
MAIILSLLAAMGAVGVLLWRIQAASDAAKGAIEVADEARGFFRRLSWSRKANRNALDLVSDPREAASAMMAAIAEYDGAMTDAERALILGEMIDNFDATQKEAEELLARGRWLAKDVRDLGQALRRLAGPLEQRLEEKERRDLIDMLRLVAGPGSVRDSVPHQAIARLEEQLFPGR